MGSAARIKTEMDEIPVPAQVIRDGGWRGVYTQVARSLYCYSGQKGAMMLLAFSMDHLVP